VDQKVFVKGGMKDLSASSEQKYPVVGVTFYTSKVVSRINALHFGASYVWDGTIRELPKQLEEDMQVHNFPLIGGNEFLMGRFVFSQALGVYIQKLKASTGRVYHHWGLYYNVFRNVLVGVNLKTHRHVADSIDFRIGYSW